MPAAALPASDGVALAVAVLEVTEAQALGH